jgi:HlyD family secretion protein
MKRTWLWISVALVVAITGAAAVLRSRGSAAAQPAAAASVPEKPTGVGARGRIEPEDGVIVVAAPYFGGRPSLISDLRVKENDWVRTGQVIAILDGYASSEKAVHQSEADVEVARMKLAQINAGAKQADIDAIKMDIARWESEYQIATSDYKRFEQLHKNEIVSSADLDQKRLLVERNKRTLDGVKERLKSLELIRKEDVDVQTAQLSAAIAQVEHARADLDRMVVHAPANGSVLKIHAHLGEEVGPQGILELAKTDRMYVVAEVYESDISRVRVRQKADITGDLLQTPLSGTVTQLGSEVSKTELLPLDPAAYADTRVVKVKIQLDHGESVAGLIYGKVDVVIHP